MLCPHCRNHFHAFATRQAIKWGQEYTGWGIAVWKCSACKNPIIDLLRAYERDAEASIRVQPLGTSRTPVPVEVPPDISETYNEACLILALSSRASAALSRRCLQQILHAHGYVARTLEREIQSLLDEPDPRKAIPGALRDTIDAIRNFGNFGAHPMTDVTTLQVIDVEPEEAEWCLEILEAMFQHFYVAPAAAKARKVALDAKLALAGKPPSK